MQVSHHRRCHDGLSGLASWPLILIVMFTPSNRSCLCALLHHWYIFSVTRGIQFQIETSVYLLNTDCNHGSLIPVNLLVHTGKFRLWHLTIRIIGRILLRPSFAQGWYVHFSIFEYFTPVGSILHRFTHANSMFESLVVPVTFSNEADEVYID